jgi:hypothetical protein
MFAVPAAASADLNFSGFGQFWYMYNDYGSAANGTMTQISDSQFLLKRARLKMHGSIPGAEYITFFSQLDFVAGDSPRYMINAATGKNGTVGSTLPFGLQLDFYINYKIFEFLQIRAGQMTLPFGYEVGRSPYDLELITYSLVYGNGQTYAGKKLGFFPYLRDLGVYVHGDYKGFNYRIGLVNGQGLTQADSIILGGNKWKDVVGRVGYNYELKNEKNPIKSLKLNAGLSAYYGVEGNYDDSAKDTSKYRIGFDVKLDWYNLLVVAEYVWGQTEMKSPGSTAAEWTFVPLKQYGAYLTAGYTIIGKIQPMIRFDYWSTEAFKNKTTGDLKVEGYWAVTAAVNYIFSKNAKLTLMYERLFPNDRAEVLYTNFKNSKQQPIIEDQLILQAAVAF